MTVTDEAVLTIERVVAGGDGLARHDGLVVFVPRTLEGEQVRARVRVRGRLARGDLTAVERPSPVRVVAKCPHYESDDCGGCQLQHAEYAEQLRIKAALVVEAFRRIAHRAVDTPGMRGANAHWRYRRKLTLALRRDDGGWYAGLRPHDDPAAVFRLDDCLITNDQVMATWKEILAASAHLPAADALRGAVQMADGAGALFHLEGGTRWDAADGFFGAVPSLGALWWTPERGRRTRMAARGDVGPTPAFAQINAEVAGELLDYVVRTAAGYRPAHAIDAYAGTGAAAARLAATGCRVTAIEIDADAAREAGRVIPSPSLVVTGRVEHCIGSALPADVVLLNPPRTGVDARVCDALASARPHPRAIIYVSCDPATLARDVSRLPGWRVERLACFDMFPQTAHVETVCELVPEAA